MGKGARGGESRGGVVGSEEKRRAISSRSK